MYILFNSKGDVKAADTTGSIMVPGRVPLKLLEKEDPKAVMAQNQQANNDVNKSTDPQKPQSTKSGDPDVSSKQGSEPSNRSASQTSKVSGMTSESAQTESQRGSSGNILGTCAKNVLVLCPNLAYCISLTSVYNFVTEEGF